MLAKHSLRTFSRTPDHYCHRQGMTTGTRITTRDCGVIRHDCSQQPTEDVVFITGGAAQRVGMDTQAAEPIPFLMRDAVRLMLTKISTGGEDLRPDHLISDPVMVGDRMCRIFSFPACRPVPGSTDNRVRLAVIHDAITSGCGAHLSPVVIRQGCPVFNLLIQRSGGCYLCIRTHLP
ncbi:hypothetical protein D3C76_1148200 [compost metagenome]